MLLLGAMLAGLLPRPALAVAPTFADAVSVPLGSSADKMATGDINNDGKPDLVVATGGVTVRINTTAPGSATPTYGTATDFSTGTDTRSVAIGDLNGDGKPDIAASNAGSGNVSVLFNTTGPGATTPTFASAVNYPTGQSPNSLVIADFNGDGKPDLAVANTNDGNVSVLLNATPPGNPAPTFIAAVNFSSGGFPFAVAAADLNGDGKVDLVLTDNAVHVLLNLTVTGAGTPTFGAPTNFSAGTTPSSVAVGDLNGDGKPDIATGNSASGDVSVLLNTTAPGATPPTFSSAVQFPVGGNPLAVAIGDLNGDGKPDLAAANRFANNVGVLQNATAPGATTPAFSGLITRTVGTQPIGVAIDDLNGDGAPDLAASNIGTNDVSILLNTTTLARPTTFSPPTAFGGATNAQMVAFADLNLDGKPDLVVGTLLNNGTVYVRLNTTPPGAATPTFGSLTPLASFVDSTTVAVGDLNGDGKPDLAVTYGNASSFVSVLFNTTTPGAATPTFGTPADFPADQGSVSVQIADLNGDGMADLAVANVSVDTIQVFLNTASPGATTPSFSAPGSYVTTIDPHQVVVADMNGDGVPDLVTPKSSSDDVSILRNNTAPGAPTSSFTVAANISVGPGAVGNRSVAVADFNGDGMPDFASANGGTNNVSVLLSTTAPGAATPSFGGATFFTVETAPFYIVSADLNGDGKPDLAVANFTSNNVSVLLNTTTPGATTPTFATTTYPTGTAPRGIEVADLNGDGRPDLATANFTSGDVSILLNDSSPFLSATAGSVAYVEDQPPVAIDAGLTIFDVSANLSSATVQVTSGYQSGQDVLACPACTGLGISATFAAGTGTLSLSGTATVASYQAALRSVTYANTSDAPSTASPRVISFQVTDAAANASNVATRQVSVTATNDAPAAVPDALSVKANVATVIPAPGVLANDSDPDGPSLTAVLVTSAAHGTVALQPNGGFTYTPTAQYSGPDSFTYKANDGIVDGNTVTVTLTVGGEGISVDDPILAEGNSGTKTMTFTVSLQPASTQPVTVQVQTQDETANAGSDYVAVPLTTLTFAPGETSKTVAVTVNGDTTIESNETFRLVFSNPVGATLVRSWGTGTIASDDTGNPTVRVQQATANGAPIPGRLQVTVTANTVECGAGNTLQRIDVGSARNARVEVPGAAAGTPGGPSSTPGAPNGTPGNFPLTVNAVTTTFFVQRQAAGDFRVDLAITDGCTGTVRPFRTFVGGGVGVQ